MLGDTTRMIEYLHEERTERDTMRKYVLDANALLAYLGQRPAASRVTGLLKEAAHCEQPLLMSVVNWGEVLHAVWTESGEDSARQSGCSESPGFQSRLRRCPPRMHLMPRD